MCQNGTTNFSATHQSDQRRPPREYPCRTESKPSICLSTILKFRYNTEKSRALTHTQVNIIRSHFFITSNLQGLQKRKTKAVKTVNVYIIASVSYLMFICILLFATFAFWQTSILSCTFNDRSIDSQQELG